MNLSKQKREMFLLGVPLVTTVKIENLKDHYLLADQMTIPINFSIEPFIKFINTKQKKETKKLLGISSIG